MKPFGMISIPVAVGLLLLTQNLEAQMHASKAALKSKKAKIQNAMSAAPGDDPACRDESTIPLRGRRKGRTWMF